LDFIISITRGEPALICDPNPEAEIRKRRLSRAAFWSAHTRPSAKTLILYTEVLFFRQTDHRAFIRFQDYNGGIGSLSFAEFKKSKPYLAEHRNRYFIRLFELRKPAGRGTEHAHKDEPKASYREVRKSVRIRRYELIPIRYYVTAGEMCCIHAITDGLSRQHVESEFRAEHTVQGLKIPDADLVLLGNVRTHGLVAKLIGPDAPDPYELFPFRVEERGIGKFQDDGMPGMRAKLAAFEDYTVPSDSKIEYLVYALLTRLKGPLPNRVSTIIAAHHTAAFKGVAACLQCDESMSRLAAALGVPMGGPFPEQFQVLFAIRITRQEEESVGDPPVAVIVDKHIPAESANGHEPQDLPGSRPRS
jgi:hypothetical protein